MVRHLTRVVLRPLACSARSGAVVAATGDDVRRMGEEVMAHAYRVAEAVEALAELGFQIWTSRDRVVAESTCVEAVDAKTLRRSRGFGDDEYQVQLEFERAWGMM